jgi:hypothetical protein
MFDACNPNPPRVLAAISREMVDKRKRGRKGSVRDELAAPPNKRSRRLPTALYLTNR